MMAIAKELIGRSSDQTYDGHRTIRRPWSVIDALSEADALAAVAAEAPSILDGLPLTTINVREDVADGGYACEANYSTIEAPQGTTGPAPVLQVGQSSFSFEVVVQPVRVVVPIEPQTVYPRTGLDVPPNSARWLIGEQGNNDPPEGCDVYEPAASFSETHIFAASSMTPTYTQAILSCVGQLNSATFRGWQAREVLCVGVSGSRRGADDWELSFRFQVKKHQTGLTVAGVSGVDKGGWDFLWCRQSLATDGVTLSRLVDYVVIAKVFREANFAALGIGS